jgi:hypothetical protein
MPSVLFFLLCVIPSIWIVSIDEANRKQRFLSLAETYDDKIKKFVSSSFDKALTGLNGSKVLNETEIKNIPRVTSTSNGNLFFIDNNGVATVMHNKHMSSISDQITMAMSLAELNNQSITPAFKTAPKLTNILGSSNASVGVATSNNTSKNIDSSNIDCCETDVTYWFKEDQYQNLFFQLFLLILVSTRWLVTSSAKISSTQRTFVLILSMANAMDTLDLFTCLSLEFVFKSTHLIYSLLFMVTISLLQFIFMPTAQHTNRSLYRNASDEYLESIASSENGLRANANDENLARAHSYEDPREAGNMANQAKLNKKGEQKLFKLKNSRLSLKFFNRGYDLSNKNVSPNIQPIMFSYGLNNTYQLSHSYPFDKVIISKLLSNHYTSF